MDIIDEAGPDRSGLDGLRQMQALVDAGGQYPIARTLRFALVNIKAGRAVLEGTPKSSVYNPLGTVHGGYAAALLDSACGCATHSRLSATQGYTTLELKVAYHRPLLGDTGLVRAEGRFALLWSSRRICGG